MRLKKILLDKQIRVHVDRRAELTPGFKFHDWELKGIPLRIEIGPKDIAKNKVVIATRHNQTKNDLGVDEIESKINPILEKIQKEMFEAAKKILEDRSVNVENYENFKTELETGGFLFAPWCGQESCEEKLRTKLAQKLELFHLMERIKTKNAFIVVKKVPPFQFSRKATSPNLGVNIKLTQF